MSAVLAPAPAAVVLPVAGRRKARRTISWVNLAVNLTITVVVVVALAFLVPALLGFQRYVITSGSMTGTYDIGSVVFSETVPVAELEVGDVITYVPPAESGIDHLVTHRIVSIDGTEFRTKGDAVGQVDPWTFQLAAATQPRAVASVPYVGHVFLALADRGTRMVVVGVPAAIIALLALGELVKALRSKDDEDVEPEVVPDLAAVIALPLPKPVPAAAPDAPAVPAAVPAAVREALLASHAVEATLAADAVLAGGAARGGETTAVRAAAGV